MSGSVLEQKQISTITNNTRVTIHLAIALIMFIAASVAGGAWWAATVSSKIDAAVRVVEKHDARIERLEFRVFRGE